MCGHFALNYINLITLMKRYGISEDPDMDWDTIVTESGFYPSRQQSSSLIPVVRKEENKKILELFRWDIVPSWWDKPLLEKKFTTYNARKESLSEKASFRTAWRKNQRCIIPATEFFEWPDKGQMPRGMPRKEHKIMLTDQEVFSLAGIWDECRIDDNSLRSCTIITVEANEAIAGIPHTRMPAILSARQEEVWLSKKNEGNAVYDLLSPYPEDRMKISV